MLHQGRDFPDALFAVFLLLLVVVDGLDVAFDAVQDDGDAIKGIAVVHYLRFQVRLPEDSFVTQFADGLLPALLMFLQPSLQGILVVPQERIQFFHAGTEHLQFLLQLA